MNLDMHKCALRRVASRLRSVLIKAWYLGGIKAEPVLETASLWELHHFD
jgi:hypothetical protein